MTYIGVIEDPRLKDEIAKDYKSEDLFGGSPEWIERGKYGWMSPILIRNQDGSYQCMAYSGAKHLGINEKRENGSFVNLSPTFIYKKRANNGAGMYMQDLLSILCTYGSPKDEWFPCDNLSDDEISKAPQPSNSVVEEALIYRGKNYLQIPSFNIDEIAKAIDIAGSCIMIIRCNEREWLEYPLIDPTVTSNDWNVNHAVTCVQYGLIDGNKYILIEDSWGWSKSPVGQRWVSEDFIKTRMFGGGYVIDLVDKKPTEKFYFSKDLSVNNSYQEDVKNLQKVLILEGCMTISEAQTGWGYFGKRTLNAVIKLQNKYRDEILTPIGLSDGTGYVGTSTRKFLNNKYV